MTTRPCTTRAFWTGWLLVAAFLFPIAGVAGVNEPHRRKDIYKDQVEQMEQAWRTAELANDIPAMDRMLADDYIGITMNGQVVTKIQQLDRARNRQLVVQKLDLDDLKVKLIGRTAVVTSLADVEGSMDGTPMHGKFRYTRVYTRMPDGEWKITNFEATPVGMPHPRPVPRNGPAPEPGAPE
jgi:ketosteroid isomerase-like protein